MPGVGKEKDCFPSVLDADTAFVMCSGDFCLPLVCVRCVYRRLRRTRDGSVGRGSGWRLISDLGRSVGRSVRGVWERRVCESS